MRQRFSLIEQASHECFVVFIRFNDSFPRTDAMRPILKVNTMNLKHSKSVLLGTSALVCFALAAPVMADDFVITSGTTTNDGNTLDGNDTVNVTGTLDIAATGPYNTGIMASGNANKITVSETGVIKAKDDGIWTKAGGNNEISVFGSITTTVSGSITTGVVGTNAGEDSTGIWNYGNDNTTTLTSTGVITVNGPKADGIYNLSLIHI